MEHRNAIALTFMRPQLSPLQLIQLYREAGSATAIVDNRKDLSAVIPEVSRGFDEQLSSLDSALARADQELEFCRKHEIQVLIPSDDAYPQRLQSCEDAPLVLYYRGSANLNTTRVINIIGTRKCTVYGQDLIASFVKGLKQACPDTLIASGLAYGVDICAHRNALEQGMDTVGVLAHGLDMIYPQMHRETAKRMLSHGGLLTEYPSQTRIDKRNFLQRNRIVAGISDACILPESAAHGGGLVTCRLSMEYGRNVYAFPGSVTAEYSKGCNDLIRRNVAQLITCADDFLQDMGWECDEELRLARQQGIERTMFLDLSAEEHAIVNALKDRGDMLADQLVMATGLAIAKVSSSLFRLEMNGIVRGLPGGIFHLVAPTK